MGDQGAHHGGIQAQQPQVVEEPNQAAVYPAQPAAQALVAAAVLQPIATIPYHTVLPSSTTWEVQLQTQRMILLDQAFRTISESDWARPWRRREPSEYIDLLDRRRSWRHRNVIRTVSWRSKAVQRGERQVCSSFRGKEKSNIWTSQVRPEKSIRWWVSG